MAKWQVALRQRLSRCSSFAVGVLHPTNHSLPDKHCTQCVGVFHSDCLNVWFRTSNGHICPLCRQPMD